MISDIPVAQQEVTTKKGSPWSWLGRKLSKIEYAGLKKWLSKNPSQKLKAWDMRSDGRFFSNYSSTCLGGELWVSEAHLDAMRKRARDRNELLRRIPGYNKERNRKRRIEYANNPLVRKNGYENSKRWHARLSEEKREKMNARYRELAKVRSAALGERYFPAQYNRHRPDMAFRAGEIRAREKGAFIHPLRNDTEIVSLFKLRHKMVITQKRNFDIDHIIPIDEGGMHHENNLQIIPARINRQKKANAFWLSDEHLDFRDVPESLWPEKLKPYYYLMLRIFGHPLKKLAETA